MWSLNTTHAVSYNLYSTLESNGVPLKNKHCPVFENYVFVKLEISSVVGS